MRKSKLKLLSLVLAGSFLFSSCIGSFKLFNNVLSWNKGVGNKFVNELVFIALHIVPVYEIAGLVDVLVLNSIEFWTGNSPIAKKGEVKQVKGENGDYTVETLENGYTITKEGEATVDLIFNNETNTWSVVSEEVTSELVKINENGTADLFLQNGETMNVTLDAQGILAAQKVTMGNVFFAAR
ncbi:DUF3332 domain-containing protein [Bacteroides sp. 214]|uniref:DUF3332 domain-containing protein n=1 Tax=Bacteroides sp. 214 TaxID=2302935 RepID=UPI0013D2BA76|nr:DUF3332 domain-containing protein [Bacteroides sp. 214]NDW13879.1 DUF3332 domain-containing protein [Bacteroides sp. 214]